MPIRFVENQIVYSIYHSSSIDQITPNLEKFGVIKPYPYPYPISNPSSALNLEKSAETEPYHALPTNLRSIRPKALFGWTNTGGLKFKPMFANRLNMD